MESKSHRFTKMGVRRKNIGKPKRSVYCARSTDADRIVLYK